MEAKETPLSSLPGYELIHPETKVISLPHYKLVKKTQGTNTSGSFDIEEDDMTVGKLDLSFALRRKEAYFDIEIAPNLQGRGHARKVLTELASHLKQTYDFSLETGGIMPESRPYWERLAAENVVAALKPDDSETNYRILPQG